MIRPLSDLPLLFIFSDSFAFFSSSAYIFLSSGESAPHLAQQATLIGYGTVDAP